MKHLEEKLQMQCVNWFKYQYPKTIIHHSPNGGNRNIREAARFKKMGVHAGFPDLFIPEWKMFIEMKYGKGKLTENQKKTCDTLRFAGYDINVVDNIDTFMQICKTKYNEIKS